MLYHPVENIDTFSPNKSFKLISQLTNRTGRFRELLQANQLKVNSHIYSSQRENSKSIFLKQLKAGKMENLISIERVRLLIQMDGEQTNVLTFGQEADTLLLLDYDLICKKILQAYRFVTSGKDKIRLNIANFYGGHLRIYIPIFNTKNWTTLIADMLRRDINEVHVTALQLGQLAKRKKRAKETPVQFDSDGSVESAEENYIKEAIVKNTPAIEPYRNQAGVRCHFCHVQSKSKKGKREAGPFYGPFQENVYAHLMCLLWMSEVYLDEDSQLCNVKEAIKKSKKWKCQKCKQKGASFYCHSTACKKMAHYSCAILDGWYFDWVTFQCYCPEERKAPFEEASNSLSTLTASRRAQLKNLKMEAEPELQLE